MHRLEQRTSPIIAILIHLVAPLLTLGVSAKRLRSSSEARVPNRAKNLAGFTRPNSDAPNCRCVDSLLPVSRWIFPNGQW